MEVSKAVPDRPMIELSQVTEMLTLDSFLSMGGKLFTGCTRDTASEDMSPVEAFRLFKQLSRRAGIQVTPELLSGVEQQITLGARNKVL